MKKIITIALILHVVIILLFLYIIFYLMGGGNVEDNLVSITKQMQIVNNYENELDTDIPKLEEQSFNGFFIQPNLIMAVAHGVNDTKSEYIINDTKGTEYNGILVNKDELNDTALIEIDRDFEGFNEIKYSQELRINEEVKAINYNGETKEGKIIELKDNIIYSDIIFSPGDSGSILLNSKGELVGINTALDTSNMQGISLSLIKTP